MCLAVPGRIVAVHDDRPTRTGTVDFDGIHKDVCLSYVPDARPGAYVLVHVGFALQVVDEAEAQEALAHFQRLGTLEDNLGVADPDGVEVGR